MSVRLGIVMDPIARINFKKDSSLAMLLAAQARGWSLFYMEQQDLYQKAGVARGRMRPLKVFNDASRWFELEAESDQPLHELDVILMRKDPPFDNEFVYSTYLLEQAERAGALVVNRPQSLRDCNEKFFATQFTQCTPPTMVSRRSDILREFAAEHRDIILKPLDGMGGSSIFRHREGDPNLSVILETLTQHGSQQIMAQRYLPEIKDGDKRILMIDGEPVPYCLARIPAQGETRGNLAAGGRGVAQPLSERDRWIAAEVGPHLRERGLLFADFAPRQPPRSAMNAAVLKSPSAAAGVRPADRLGFTLFIAAILHVAFILGVGFSMPAPSQISKTLEITLATFKSDKAPEKADYLAQMNQQGSGTLEHKAAPKTTEVAPFQDNQVKKVAPPATPKQARSEEAPKAAVTTTRQRQQKAPSKTQAQKAEQVAKPAPHFDSTQLSAEIASLEADLAKEQQAYAKRPRIHRLSAASTMRDKGAWYKEDWRKKIERIGNLNYPDEARRQKLYGSLRLLVSINRDGTIYEVQVLESSGEPILDQAAQRIVRLAAPYAPFSGDLADIDRLEIIRTWRFERGDRLSSK